MEIDLQNLQFTFRTDDESCLCFKHAVEAANEGKDVDVCVAEFGRDHYRASSLCFRCTDETYEKSKVEVRELVAKAKEVSND